MNQEQFLGALRNLTMLGCGIAIGHGWITAEQSTLIVGAIVSLGPLAWSYFAHTNAAKLIAAAGVPEVKSIVVDRNSNGKIGDAADSPSTPKIVKEGS
jgi:glycerol-3-phosphate dehydrogenase